MNNRDALEDEIAARKREDEANLTMLRFATAKHATPLLDAQGGRDEIADKIVEAKRLIDSRPFAGSRFAGFQGRSLTRALISRALTSAPSRSRNAAISLLRNSARFGRNTRPQTLPAAVSRPSEKQRIARAGRDRFVAEGWAEKARSHGWSERDLVALPERWSRIDQCGVAWLVGERRVIEATADAIAIETELGARLSFYRRAL